MQEQVRVTEAAGWLRRRAFFRFPWLVYKGDANWVPPLLMQVKQTLDTRKNPFYKRAKIKLFLASKRGRRAGRVAAIISDAHNEFHGEKAGFFGFFECVNDQQVADALLSAAGQWLGAGGMEILRGPISPSTNHECALLVDGFDRSPMVMMPYNPPYYADLLEGFGLVKAKDSYAYELSATSFDPRLYKLADRLAGAQAIEYQIISFQD